MNGFKQKAFWGVVWRGGYQAYHHLASLVVKIILVRFLLPADFGLVAMALIVFSSLDLINRFAGGEPFIRDNISDGYKSKNTLFFISTICHSATALIVFYSSPHVASFFSAKIPDTHSVSTLILIIKVLSFKLLLSIPATVPMNTLTKELRFKELYMGNIAGTTGFFIISPVLAFWGFGVWSIIIGNIVEQIIITSIYFFYSPFIPSLIFDKKIAKNYLKYNSNIFVSSIVVIIITQGDDTIIGRLMGPAILGFYNIGQQFAMLSFSIVAGNITEIIFPVLSKVQDDKEMYKNAALKTFRFINLLGIPLIGGLIVLANDIVFFLFGEKWMPMVPVFYILSISIILDTITSISGPVLKSLNKIYVIRNCQLIKLVFFLFMIYPAAKGWGYLGVSWVMVILSIVNIAYLLPQVAKEVDFFYIHAIRTLFGICGCTLVMMLVIHLIKSTIPSPFVSIFLSGIAGTVVYFITQALYDNQLFADARNFMVLIKEKLRYSAT